MNSPVEQGGDGVVTYSSAHIDGVESELIVRSSHSCQGDPRTIEEVRRILRLHMAEASPTTASDDDVYAFRQEGWMAGAGPQGTKITRIPPE